MRCVHCQGDGEVYVGDEAFKCCGCNGTGQVVRFITETKSCFTDIERYLKGEPHPHYRLVTIQKEEQVGYHYFYLFWERNV